MAIDIAKFWDEKFSSKEYIYGKEPNKYVKKVLDKLKPGCILFPAEGEGRNAVYAATKGWDVYAFDPSISGKNKAMELAKTKNLSIDYQINDVEKVNYKEESFDAIVLVFAHFHKNVRRAYHQKLSKYLKKGGHIILEAFSQAHIKNQQTNPKAGGPKNIDLLYNLEELKEDFNNFEFIVLEETSTKLEEGEHHVGKSNVLRILAKKIN